MSVRTLCLACGSTNVGAQHVCVVCGGALARACQHCGAAVRQGSERCVTCGRALTISFQPVGWRATHVVPPEGMAAWGAPDPSLAPTAMLPGRIGVLVTEERGAWSQVLCDNGWTGWVDGRLLERA